MRARDRVVFGGEMLALTCFEESDSWWFRNVRIHCIFLYMSDLDTEEVGLVGFQERKPHPVDAHRVEVLDH